MAAEPTASPPPQSPALEDCALIVAISAHNAPARVAYLMELVRTLSDMPVGRLQVHVMTNDIPPEAAAAVKRVLDCGLTPGRGVAIHRCLDLAHPFNLTWAHKPLITKQFLVENSAWTHFVYLEDDMRFGTANLRYFLRNRPLLAPFGLLPSFIRVEYSAETIELRLTDQGRVQPARMPGVTVDGRRFIQPPNPYCALFVLDQELAREHLASPSFDIERSLTLNAWPVRERAAAGLCWHDPPPGFPCRYVVPLDAEAGTYANECWVPHLAATYADNPRKKWGKVPATTPFIPDAR